MSAGTRAGTVERPATRIPAIIPWIASSPVGHAEDELAEYQQPDRMIREASPGRYFGTSRPQQPTEPEHAQQAGKPEADIRIDEAIVRGHVDYLAVDQSVEAATRCLASGQVRR